MLLKPKNLEEMTRQLHALPENQRRVIVLVGRHLNEGTRTLAVRHHNEWEKHGAVAVCVPAIWTPHGFYHDVKRQIQQGLDRNTDFRHGPDDIELVKRINESGFDVPIVNFHGTPDPRTSGFLAYYMKTNDSRLKLPENWIRYEPGNNLSNDHPNVHVVHAEMDLAPFEMLVEYHFEPDYKRMRSTLSERIIKAMSSNPLAHILNSPQLSTEYLDMRNIGRNSLKTFAENHHEHFLELLDGLSKNGLQMDGKRP